MKKLVSLVLALAMLLSMTAALADTVGGMEDGWWKDIEIAPSETFHLDEPLTITALGIHFNQYPTEFDGCYYLPTVEKYTNVHLQVDWRPDSDWNTQIATALAGGVDNLPYLIRPGSYGVAALANEGAIVPLDDYLDLIPNIVAAVGEERFADWKAADGHFYTIPTLVNVPGSQSTAVRKDWLEKLNMDVPTTWEEWKAYWYGVRDNDMNGNGDTTDEIPIVLEMSQNGERSLHALLNAFGIKASSDAQFCVLDDGTYTMVYEHPLWLIVGHWNDYLNPLVLIHSQEHKTLQLFLKELVLNAETSTSNLASVNDATNKGVAALSQQLKNGVLVVSMVPMLVLYPFLQKFFVSGVMLGSVKG